MYFRGTLIWTKLPKPYPFWKICDTFVVNSIMILILYIDLDLSIEIEWRCKFGTEEEKWTFVIKYMMSKTLDVE